MKREELQHFFDTSMGQETAYALIGDGVSSLSEEFNPEDGNTQWINQANGNTDIKSYSPTLEVTKEDCIDDDMQTCIDTLVDSLPTGTAAESFYIRLRLKDKTADGVYKAYKRRCSVSVSSTGGDAGNNVSNTIKIGGKGDAIAGTFDVATKKFTAGAPDIVKAVK